MSWFSGVDLSRFVAVVMDWRLNLRRRFVTCEGVCGWCAGELGTAAELDVGWSAGDFDFHRYGVGVAAAVGYADGSGVYKGIGRPFF